MDELSTCELGRAHRALLRLRLAQDIPRLATDVGFDVMASADPSDPEGEGVANECADLVHLVGLLDHIGASFRDDAGGQMPIASVFLPMLGSYAHERVLRAKNDQEAAVWTAISVRAQNASADSFDGMQS
jgi:hypothetical protein